MGTNPNGQLGGLKFENGVSIAGGRRSGSVDGGVMNSVGSGGGGCNSGQNHLDNGIDKILASPNVDRKEFDFSKVNCKHIFINYLINSIR